MQQAIYARLSKDKTGAGLAVERQVAEVIGHFKLPSATPVYSDNDLSASTGVIRPDYLRLLADIEAGKIRNVYVWHTDRLWRLPRDLEDFIDAAERHNISAYAKQAGIMDLSTPAGRVGARIGVSIAKYEVEIKGERQRAKNLQVAQKGLPHITHRAFGYEKDGMTIRPDEAETLHLMAKLVLAGNSYQETAWQLNERGLRTSRGAKFIGLQVCKMIQNKRYAGVREYQGVDYPAQWPAILDADTWQQLQIVAKLRRDLGASRSVGRRFLLTGLLYCGVCGHMLTGVTERHSRTRQVHRAYRCFRIGRTERQGGCGKIYRNAEHLETYIRELVLFRLDTPALAKLLHPEAGQLTSSGKPSVIASLLEQRHNLHVRKDSLTSDYGTGLLTRSEFARAKQAAQTELERIETEIGKLTARSAAIELPLDKTLAEAWDGHRDEWRRRLLDLLIERVDLLPGNMNKTVRRLDGTYYRFNPQLVGILWRV